MFIVANNGHLQLLLSHDLLYAQDNILIYMLSLLCPQASLLHDFHVLDADRLAAIDGKLNTSCAAVA